MLLPRSRASAIASQVLLLTALAASLPAAAQSTGTGVRPSWGEGNSSLWAPGSGRTSIGLNLGRSEYQVGCGNLPLGCDDEDRYIHLYGRSMVNDYLGAELGVLDMGNIDRGGGSTKAQGINLSLVGRAPLGNRFSLYGKLGTTYGRTRTSAAPLSGLAEGTEHGFGLAYGAGVSYDITPRLSAVLEWDSHDLRFAGGGRDPVRATSLGLQYRY